MQAWGVIALDAGVRTMQCPDCNGTGILKNVHHNTGYNSRHHYWGDAKCFRCNGVGVVPDEMADWIIFGKDFREKRRLRGETIGDTAKRLKLSVCELSAIENGRINYALYLQTMP